jgi:hypothetical protein
MALPLDFIRSVSCGFYFVSFPQVRNHPSSVSLRLTPSPQGEGYFYPIYYLLH